jgi:hypothetical protein
MKKNIFFRRRAKKSAFTLIEAAVLMFIFSVVSIAFYKLMSQGMSSMNDNQSRASSTELARETIELIRNIEYDKITTDPDVAGALAEDQNVSKSGKTFRRFISVEYVDDNFDGIGEADSNAKPMDYKKITVAVSWDLTSETINPSKSVTLSALFAPPTVENVYDGGILSINVIGSDGKGIPNAEVKIENASNPTANETVNTNADGKAFFYAKPAGDLAYYFKVIKDGYFSVESKNATASFNPNDPYASVVEGNINQQSIVTDKNSDFNVFAKDIITNADIPDVQFDLKGGKKIGEPIPGSSNPFDWVYAFEDTNLKTGADGKKSFSDMSFGSYFLTFQDPKDQYKFVRMGEILDQKNQFNIPADSDSYVSILLADKNTNSFLATVVEEKPDDPENPLPIADAIVQLKNDSLGYDVTLNTNKFGQAFFPDSGAPLTEETYDLKVTATGYGDYSGTRPINGLVDSDVYLIPN